MIVLDGYHVFFFVFFLVVVVVTSTTARVIMTSGQTKPGYFGPTYTTMTPTTADASSTPVVVAQWTWLFWIGESTVMGMFIFNSIGGSLPGLGLPLYGAIAIFSILMSLWIRGRFWTYVSILVFQLVLLLLTLMAFPVIEMMLETILNEKLRKVGDKVRAHQKHLEAYYANQMLARER